MVLVEELRLAHLAAREDALGALIGLDHGIDHVQGTINGFGERCGNANLTSILPAMIFKMGLECQAKEHIENLYPTSRLVNEMANLRHNRYQPYVGDSAFAHKGGIHVNSVLKHSRTYEHIPPETVGN